MHFIEIRTNVSNWQLKNKLKYHGNRTLTDIHVMQAESAQLYGNNLQS